MPDRDDAIESAAEPDAARDRELGLFAPITRRDVLHGISAALVGSLAAPWVALADPASGATAPEGADYPPARTGMRGSHPGSFEVAHERVLGGRRWREPRVLDERYDLVVVGAGISGLAAGYFYQRAAGKDARILILDNHDDFGGHAKRNEFRHGGKTHVALGGSVYLEYGHYSDTTHGLLRAIGVDIEALREQQDPDFLGAPLGLGPGIYFDAASFGRDVLITGEVLPLSRTGADGRSVLAGKLGAMPVSAQARRELARFLDEHTDYLPEVPDDRKALALQKLSYLDFLSERVGLGDEAVQLFRHYPHPYWGLGIDALSVYTCVTSGLPGARGLGAFGRALEQEMAGASSEPEGAVFADGNASLARMLTRALVPASASGSTMQDIASARFDYAQLDRPGSPVRLRLESTAVHVDPLPDGSGSDLTYVRRGVAYRVRARNCVLACYNAMIPSLCPALPQAQQDALRYGQKTPLVSSNVLLREGTVLERAGAARFYNPGRLHAMAFAQGRALGRYAAGWSPSQPVVLQLFAALASGTPGATANRQFVEGRRRLLAMRFEDFEREIRVHLAGMLGGAGFDPVRDILAITVNRWPHGYAYDRNTLFDPEWRKGEAPNEIGRRRLGRIAIANSDAGFHAYVDGAIDEAHRAVEELAKAGLI